MHLPLLSRAAALMYIFYPWDKSQWVTEDDSLEGGKSHSTFGIIQPGEPGNPFPANTTVFNFSGVLSDVGGYGFASQRTVDGWAGLDLSAYTGLTLQVPFSDGKRYTFNLKDTIAPVVNGVQQAGVSWEFDFQVPAVNHTDGGFESVVVPFEKLTPTFQGQVLNNSAPLNLTGIKRVSFMIRTFFAEQMGDFELHIKDVVASS